MVVHGGARKIDWDRLSGPILPLDDHLNAPYRTEKEPRDTAEDDSGAPLAIARRPDLKTTDDRDCGERKRDEDGEDESRLEHQDAESVKERGADEGEERGEVAEDAELAGVHSSLERVHSTVQSRDVIEPVEIIVERVEILDVLSFHEGRERRISER